MSRQVFLSGVGICVIALAFLLTCHLLPPEPGITEANCRRSRTEMTLQQVEAILGKRTDPTKYVRTSWSIHWKREDKSDEYITLKDNHPIPRDAVWCTSWDADGASITVFFDSNQRVRGAYFCPDDEPPSLSERFRSWLGME